MIEQCDGYKKLLAAVENDERESSGAHDYRGKLKWIIDRAAHYAEKTGLTVEEILNAWESDRSYWYMNYYQEANQPEIKEGAVRVFETVDDLRSSIGNDGFVCPHCKGVSRSPTKCDSGINLKLMNGGRGPCDWKSYGLFGTLGQGVYVFCKDKVSGQNIFMPVAWQNNIRGPKT